MPLKVTLPNRYKIACNKLGISLEEGATKLMNNPATGKPYSYRNVSEIIKYPKKNIELHNSVVDFCDRVESMKVEYVEQ